MLKVNLSFSNLEECGEYIAFLYNVKELIESSASNLLVRAAIAKKDLLKAIDVAEKWWIENGGREMLENEE